MGLVGDGKDVMKHLLLSFIIFSFVIISVGSVGADMSCTGQPNGAYCGACLQSGCHIDPYWETLDYWIGGTKTCQGEVCSSSTCSYQSVCSDSNLFDEAPEVPGWISVSACAAACDQDSDCEPYLYNGGVCYYNSFCSGPNSCQCGYDSSQECLPDGNYCEGSVVETRDYFCTANGCDYTVTESYNCNNEDVCDGQETCSAGSCVSGTPLNCDNGLFCDGVETCDAVLGCQSGTAPACDDSISCTVDSCDETNDKCNHNPNDALCQNGLYCDGAETCDAVLGCQSGTAVDCSGNNLNPFSECNHNPDNNPITLDVFLGFTSVCSESTDSCTQYHQWDFLTHTCNQQQCGAECDENPDCVDKCVDDVLYNSGVCSLVPNCICSWTQTNCNNLDCSTGIQCVVNGNTMHEEGDDYSCTGTTEVACGIIGKKSCNGPWTCGTQCAVQGCGGVTYTCYNNNWVLEIPTKEICNNQIDDDCDGLIDCADPDCMDSTLPVTTKSYGIPLIEEVTGGYPKWITSQTPITLSATDPQGNDECVSGVDETYYRITLVSDTNCYETCSTTGTGSFLIYAVPFTIPEDSCHLIEYYSVDEKGNAELTKKQCVFVDNQAPDTTKLVGEVKTEWHPNEFDDDYETSYFYPDETAHCWDGTGEEIECWKVTLDTPIDITCADDSEPHPVGFEKLCFKVSWDAVDVTANYCSFPGYSFSGGYCCGTSDIIGFKFLEESEHNLEYYCEDRLENRKYDDEKFKVFGEMYEIPLNKKWNLISVPFDPLNKEPEVVFSEVEDNIDSVWSYDAEMKKWNVYRPDAPSETNNLEEIKTGLGYWVMALGRDILNIGGSLISPGNMVPPSTKIAKGWNLIGHYGTESKEVYCSLLSLVDTQQGFPRWSSLWGYDNPSQTFIPLEFLSDSTNPGEGYWMEIDVDESYSPSSGCFYLNT